MPDAVRLIDKQPGETSHDVVARVRREFDRASARRKTGHPVGHAGTLDPFATGLLLVLVGRATRIQRWLMHQHKTYVATARFGWTSSTADPEGELVETGRLPAEPLVLPTGLLRQRPPAHSAIHIDGERAYKRARRGEHVEMPEREVEVQRFERVTRDTFEIECSSGTYVRSLIADLGDAYCTQLRRTAIGPFSVQEAGKELSLGDALARVLPSVVVTAQDAQALIHGRSIGLPEGLDAPEALLCDEDGPIAVCERRAAIYKPVVGFRAS